VSNSSGSSRNETVRDPTLEVAGRGKQRIFFALWPDLAAREALAALSAQTARRCGGRSVPAGNLHLTLAFLGDVDTARVEDARRAAATVRARPFDLVLDRLGSFRRARVAWAGCQAPDSALLQLAAALAQALRNEAFVLEARPFSPHLTLVRDLRDALRDDAMIPVGWRAQSLALVESDRRSGGYRTLEQWPLKAK
jgi:2'-5' RNA ligase